MRQHLDGLVVDLRQQPVREDLRRRTVGRDTTGAQNRDPVRLRGREPQIVQHHDHGVPGVRPFPSRPQHQLLVLQARARRGGRGREFGRCGEGAGGQVAWESEPSCQKVICWIAAAVSAKNRHSPISAPAKGYHWAPAGPVPAGPHHWRLDV